MSFFMNLILESPSHWHWLALAVVCGIFELIASTNLFLLCCVIASLITAGVAAWEPALGWQYQFMIFAVTTMLSSLIWYRWWKHQPTDSGSTLNRRSLQYVGRIFVLETPLKNGRGRLQVDGTIWTVSGPDLPGGTEVKVLSVDGMVLQVEAHLAHLGYKI